MHGRYPDYDVLEQAGHWDETTRAAILDRVENVPPLRFFTPEQARCLRAFVDVLLAQDAEPRIPVLELVDAKLHAGRLDGFRYAGMPDDRETWRIVAAGLDEAAGGDFSAVAGDAQHAIVARFAAGELTGGAWERVDVERAWSVVMRGALSAFYSHPWAWNEIGFGGPAYPRGYMRLNAGDSGREPFEAREASTAPVSERPPPALWKGARFPRENDSAFLLDVHTRGIPGAAACAATRDDDEVDLLIVGAGAGGSTLAQRLARKGWRIVVLESGPFWDPDRDWVSDEAGQHHIYWTADRVIGGEDPVELGKNNCGHGVGGSMVHYAGYTPRFHPSDFEVRSRDGVGADWPIRYEDLKAHYERVESELPVAGQDWPWGDPHRYPHAAHPISGAAEEARRGMLAAGIEARIGPVGIPNGTFGNRPHCIYRGFCLQACKVNAKASPLVTHLPDAIEHGVEVRADSHAVRSRSTRAGAAPASPTTAAASCASSARRSWRSAATRSRPRGCS